MSESDYDRLVQFNKTLHLCKADPTCDLTQLRYHNITNLDDLNLPGDGSPLLRTAISTVYCIVCALGFVSNVIVLCLLRSGRKSTVNSLVFNLAVTDLLFSLVQPFWAVDMALDYSWPFGWWMCKVISLLTALSVYTGVFFLTAMSVTRYYTVANALKPAKPQVQRISLVRLTTCLIWLGSLLAAAPTVVFSNLANVNGDQLCLLQFPEGTFWLGVHHLLRVVLGFLLPYTLLILFYLLLLCFLYNHDLRSARRRCQTRVSRSVAVVVLSYCVCWFPFNVITFWGILIKWHYLELTSSFYVAHTYFFPLASCLAHTNSCLNPVIYCLVRTEFRLALRKVLHKPGLSKLCKASLSVANYGKVEACEEKLAIPLSNLESHTVNSYIKKSPTLNIIPSPRYSSPLPD